MLVYDNISYPEFESIFSAQWHELNTLIMELDIAQGQLGTLSRTTSCALSCREDSGYHETQN